MSPCQALWLLCPQVPIIYSLMPFLHKEPLLRALQKRLIQSQRKAASPGQAWGWN